MAHPKAVLIYAIVRFNQLPLWLGVMLDYDKYLGVHIVLALENFGHFPVLAGLAKRASICDIIAFY